MSPKKEEVREVEYEVWCHEWIEVGIGWTAQCSVCKDKFEVLASGKGEDDESDE